MPPGEVPVTCPGCGYRLQIPFAAVRRNNLYCPQCGKQIPLSDVQMTSPTGPTPARRPRRSGPPMRRR